MSTFWAIQTHGDPMGAIHHFVSAVWKGARLDGMLVPGMDTEMASGQPRLIEDPARLVEVNPFKPVMNVNTAKWIPDLLQKHSDERLGVLLRPCEMRALIEMVKHRPFNINHLLTISVDCLGTMPLDEYQWRLAKKGSEKSLSQEAMQFARQGGILAYRYRPACQACPSPRARGANLNLHILGLPVRQVILVEASQEDAQHLGLEALTAGIADPSLVQQHEKVVARVEEQHQRTLQRVTQSLGEILPRDIDALIKQLESCGDCQSCMEACPICSVDFPRRDEHNRLQRKDVMRWLISCAGCGMCEQSCSRHLPLSAIFGHIRRALDEALEYEPGHSWDEVLPTL